MGRTDGLRPEGRKLLTQPKQGREKLTGEKAEFLHRVRETISPAPLPGNLWNLKELRGGSPSRLQGLMLLMPSLLGSVASQHPFRR